MDTIRHAVFDTNVLISAYLWPGTPRKALDIVRSGRCTMFSAQPALEEFVRTLRVVTRDPTDNLFLEIALQGRCTTVVSGDRHLLDLHHYRSVRILTPAEFVHSFQEK